MTPSIFPLLPREDYDQMKGWNASLLKVALNQTPAHAWRQFLDPARSPSKETPAMRIGTLTHLALLEPEEWARVVPCSFGSTTKAFASAQAEAEAQGKRIAQDSEHDLASGMAASVRSHPILSSYFPEEGHQLNELTISWETPSGSQCRARLDAVRWTGEHLWIGDLKTTFDAGWDEFGRSAVNYNYLLQAAFYSDGIKACRPQLEALLNLPEGLLSSVPTVFEFVAIEKEAPYLIARYHLTEEQESMGRKMYEKALGLVEAAASIDYWAGYDVVPKPLELPGWADRSIARLLGEA